jgi:hypothetical protein
LSPSANPTPSPNRIRLFRIQPGFLSDPPGLDNDDKTTPDEAAKPDPDGGPDWISIAVGNDNPYFDFRRSSEPGGVGYTRINTQVQLFDTNKTACSVALQAVTPAGQQSDGLADKMGTTVVSPMVSLFHTLPDDTTGLQAYVGKHVTLQNAGTQQINPNFQYGLGLHRPITTDENDPFRYVYLSVGALGQVRTSDVTASTASLHAPPSLEVLPGLHYKMTDSCWISGGMVLPVGNTPRLDTTPGQQWQVTCSFQF